LWLCGKIFRGFGMSALRIFWKNIKATESVQKQSPPTLKGAPRVALFAGKNILKFCRFGHLIDDSEYSTTKTTSFIKLDATAIRNKIVASAKIWQTEMIKFILETALKDARKLDKQMQEDIAK
jgi:hypothetical protein